MDTTPSLVCQHYLRTPDGTIYGPVDRATLCSWAVDARMIPGCELSTDRATWLPVQSLPELRLTWSVQFSDGTTYGPLNLLAIWTLASEKAIPFGVALVEEGTSNRAVLDDSLLPLLVEECRAILGSCGTIVTDVISKLGGAHQAALEAVAGREARIEELLAKLEQADFDRGNLEKHHSETQQRLVESDATAARMAILESEGASLRAGLVTAHAYQMTQWEAELEACQAELAACQSEGGSRQAELEARQAELEACKAELEVCQAELTVCRAERADLQHQLVTEKSTRENLEGRSREVESLTTQLSQVREALAKAKREGRAAELKVKDEKESILRDLNNLMLANMSLKQVSGREKVRPVPIDWVVVGTADSETAPKGEGVEARFSRLTLNEKFAALQKELQASAEEKDGLRRDLETVRGRYEYLQTETARKEKESAEKLAQIKKEIKTSSEMMTRAMEELEKRESQIRDMRKRADAGNVESARKPSILDAVVVHSEVLGPDASDECEPVGAGASEKPEEIAPGPARGGGVLNTVEAQLQRELKKWQALKQDENNKGGTFGKWFRRKKS
jgi:septal ring factor EnvC (AmiA/AmiB activator)